MTSKSLTLTVLCVCTVIVGCSEEREPRKRAPEAVINQLKVPYELGRSAIITSDEFRTLDDPSLPERNDWYVDGYYSDDGSVTAVFSDGDINVDESGRKATVNLRISVEGEDGETGYPVIWANMELQDNTWEVASISSVE